MIDKITHSQLYVLDHEEALDFYVGKLGLEVHTDVDMGFMRWLTVRVPGDQHEILLELPERPGNDPATAELVREVTTKGGGSWIGLHTEDCRATHAELVERGVEFTSEPTDHFYGVDCALRDPFGNAVRIIQPAPRPLDIPKEYSGKA